MVVQYLGDTVFGAPVFGGFTVYFLLQLGSLLIIIFYIIDMSRPKKICELKAKTMHFLCMNFYGFYALLLFLWFIFRCIN